MADEDDTTSRRYKRAVTQRYDMAALRRIQAIEEEFVETLASFYGCPEDELPEIDTLAIFNARSEDRESLLVGCNAYMIFY